MKKTLWAAQLLLLLTLNTQLSTAVAQGTAFTYQGRLNDGAGAANGIYDLRFAIYDAASLGTQQGGLLTNSATGVSNGLFTVALDFGNQFPGAGRWLEIAVRTNGGGSFFTLSPRQALTPAPYAITAGNVVSGGLTSGTYGNAITFSNVNDSFSGAFTGNGANVTNVNAAALNGLSAGNFWQLGGNNASSGQFIGTTNNVAFDLYADGLRALRLVLLTDSLGSYSNAPNVIGGCPANQVGTGVVGGTVGGGGGNDRFGDSLPNTVAADFGTISGGIDNTASGESSTVTGGTGNTASGTAAVVGGAVNTASAQSATVAGGYNNTASGNYASVAGGYGNMAGGIGSFIGGGGYDGSTNAGNFVNSKAATIGGGLGNQIPGGAEYAVIGGGAYNTNSGYGSFIGGGGYDGTLYGRNLVQANAATVGGGKGNTIPGGGEYAVISGGEDNTASGNSSVVAGGTSNIASGGNAMVVGGFGNTAAGALSFAAGQFASANHNGAFVWADDNIFSFSSTAANQFNVRATGGVRIVTAIDSGGTPTAGVKLTPGDTAWGTICDRNAKKNFQPVDGEAVLEKLAAVPVQKWNYKWEADATTPHLGPMAQDFKAAFYPGRDDKSITTLEFDGVELAAIQGLNEKLEAETKAKDAEILSLKTQNDSLTERVNWLEAAVKALAAKK